MDGPAGEPPRPNSTKKKAQADIPKNMVQRGQNAPVVLQKLTSRYVFEGDQTVFFRLEFRPLH